MCACHTKDIPGCRLRNPAQKLWLVIFEAVMIIGTVISGGKI